MGRMVTRLGAACMLAILAACATPPDDPEARADFEAQNDPLEPTNRAIFDANLFLDRNFFKPVAQGYVDVVPKPGRRAVHNVLKNLNEPLAAFNHTLQGNPGRGFDSLSRFVVNTTLGVGGLFDVAEDWGVPYKGADYGQTLGVWGVGEGPFLVLPFFGPSNPRDAVGFGAAAVSDPFDITFDIIDANYASFLRGGVQAIDTRSRNLDTLDEIQRNSLDFYATLRSLYRQSRQADIEEAKHPEGHGGQSGSVIIE